MRVICFVVVVVASFPDRASRDTWHTYTQLWLGIARETQRDAVAYSPDIYTALFV